MADEEGWKRLGSAVRRRRVELGSTQQEIADAADVSLATWRLVETAGRDRYQDLTVRGVTKALGWRIDAFDLLLDGPVADDELVAQPTFGRTTVEGLPAGLASRWHDLTMDEQAKVSGFIDGLLASRRH